MTTPQAPPALADRPQFTAEHWTKVPRQTAKAHIQRVTNLPVPEGEEPWVEIVLKEGAALRRPKADIQQLLTANLEVHIETIQGELVTGLFVPNCGWAFRMTAQDLADYTKELSVQQHLRHQAALEQTALAFAQVITQYLVERCGGQFYEAELVNSVGNASPPYEVVAVNANIDTLDMAKTVMLTMNQLVQGGQK